MKKQNSHTYNFSCFHYGHLALYISLAALLLAVKPLSLQAQPAAVASNINSLTETWMKASVIQSQISSRPSTLTSIDGAAAVSDLSGKLSAVLKARSRVLTDFATRIIYNAGLRAKKDMPQVFQSADGNGLQSPASGTVPGTENILISKTYSAYKMAPVDASTLAPEQDLDVYYTAKLDDDMKAQIASDPEAAFLYFASVNGVLRFFPGALFPSSTESKKYDPRATPWYTRAITGVRSVVLLLHIPNNASLDFVVKAATQVLYSLSPEDELMILLTQSTDKPTPYIPLTLPSSSTCASSTSSSSSSNQDAFLTSDSMNAYATKLASLDSSSVTEGPINLQTLLSSIFPLYSQQGTSRGARSNLLFLISGPSSTQNLFPSDQSLSLDPESLLRSLRVQEEDVKVKIVSIAEPNCIERELLQKLSCSTNGALFEVNTANMSSIADYSQLAARQDIATPLITYGRGLKADIMGQGLLYSSTSVLSKSDPFFQLTIPVFANDTLLGVAGYDFAPSEVTSVLDKTYAQSSYSMLFTAPDWTLYHPAMSNSAIQCKTGGVSISVLEPSTEFQTVLSLISQMTAGSKNFDSSGTGYFWEQLSSSSLVVVVAISGGSKVTRASSMDPGASDKVLLGNILSTYISTPSLRPSLAGSTSAVPSTSVLAGLTFYNIDNCVSSGTRFGDCQNCVCEPRRIPLGTASTWPALHLPSACFGSPGSPVSQFPTDADYLQVHSLLTSVNANGNPGFRTECIVEARVLSMLSLTLASAGFGSFSDVLLLRVTTPNGVALQFPGTAMRSPYYDPRQDLAYRMATGRKTFTITIAPPFYDTFLNTTLSKISVPIRFPNLAQLHSVLTAEVATSTLVTALRVSTRCSSASTISAMASDSSPLCFIIDESGALLSHPDWLTQSPTRDFLQASPYSTLFLDDLEPDLTKSLIKSQIFVCGGSRSTGQSPSSAGNVLASPCKLSVSSARTLSGTVSAPSCLVGSPTWEIAKLDGTSGAYLLQVTGYQKVSGATCADKSAVFSSKICDVDNLTVRVGKGGGSSQIYYPRSTECQEWSMPKCDDSFYAVSISSCDSTVKRSIRYSWHYRLANQCRGGLPDNITLDCSYVPSNSNIAYLFNIMACMIIVCTLVGCVLVYVLRSKTGWGTTSPTDMIVAGVGCLFGMVFVLVESGGPSASLCLARPLLLCISADFSLGSFTITAMKMMGSVPRWGAMTKVSKKKKAQSEAERRKTVHELIRNPDSGLVPIKQPQIKPLTLMVGILFFDILLYLLYAKVDPPLPATSVVRASDGQLVEEMICSASGGVFDSISVAAKTILVLTTCGMTVMAERATLAVDRYHLLAVYNVVTSAVFGQFAVYVCNLSPKPAYIITCTLAVWAALSILMLTMWPKLIEVRFGEKIHKKVMAVSSTYQINYGDLEMIQTLGAGSYGEVTKGSYKHTAVAIKKLKDSIGEREMETFGSEVSIMAELHHPNIVMMMGFCISPPLLVMELLARGSLYNLLHGGQSLKLEWSMIFNILMDTARGMGFLHEHSPPIIHGDFKTPNVLVDSNWRCKISDFGLSNLTKAVKKGDKGPQAVGSLLWGAPEIFTGQEPTLQSDVYAFGIVMFEVIFRRVPYEDIPGDAVSLQVLKGIRPLDLIALKMEGKPIAEAEILGPVYDKVKALMEACWHQTPAKRPTFRTIITQINSMAQTFTGSDDWESLVVYPKAPAESPSAVRHGNRRAVGTLDEKDLELGYKIGEGASGAVFEGIYKGRIKVAVKQLFVDGVKTEILDEFHKEVSIMKDLDHPNLVALIGSLEKPPKLLIATELMEKGSLWDYYHHEPRISNYQEHYVKALQIGLDIAKGMTYLHDKEIIHRDLKSQNVWLTRDLIAKVGDFGMSRITDSTKTMTQCGSPLWCAPEVLTGQRYQYGCDIFSFSIILWEVVTWSEPFQELSVMEVVAGVTQQNLRPPMVETWSQELKDLFIATWRPEWNERLHFKEICAKLQALIDVALAPPPPKPRRRESTLGRSSVSAVTDSEEHAAANGSPTANGGSPSISRRASLLKR